MKYATTLLFTLISFASLAQFPFLLSNTPESFEERLMRESLPIGDASIFGYTTSITNTTIAGNNTVLLNYGPSPTEMHYIKGVYVYTNEAFEGSIVSSNSLITPTGVAQPIVPILMPATGGQYVGMANRFIPEKSSISIQSLAAQGSSTFKLRAGFEGVRVAKDFLKQAKRVILKIGDSISDGTRLTYGEESYDYKLLNWLEQQTGTTWREVSKAKASFASNHIEALRTTGQLWPKQADVIIYHIGMNDTDPTLYSTVLSNVLAEKNQRFPNATMLVFTPTPSPIGSKPNLPQIRTNAANIVSATTNGRTFLIDNGTLWDASNSSDLATYTPGADQVHPLPVGHTAIYNNSVARMTANSSYILNLIKTLP